MKDKKTTKKSIPNLLPDTIPENDAFGHTKIADAIYNLINEEKEGGKAIALSGGFGSGKSAVIDFLRRKFEEEENKRGDEETKVFTFDAWEHQGDPLRRAFIEEYVKFFENNKWVDEGEFDDELDKISKRREEIETTTEPIISKQGGRFALLLLLVPLGLSLVRYGTIDKNLFWVNIIGFVLILCPIIYVSFLLIRFDEKRRQSVFNLFFKKTKENIKSKSLKTPDPTTIEFQRVFNDITNEVLFGKNRRLIIVIDNIDRLTTKSSIDAWTTLRTFFDNENKDWKWKDQFWLIAPFDFNELSDLWRGLNHIDESGGKGKNSTDYVKSFIDKTFQVTFRVPKPVLSDWKNYFKDCLKEAFPDVQEEIQFDIISTLYQLERSKNLESPTPRDIKQYINRVIAQYRVWYSENEITLPVLAYYELICDKPDLVNSIKSGTIASFLTKSILKEKELTKKIAAIHFNCKLDKAYQVLYGDQIAEAIHTGHSKSIIQYIDTDGFRDVLTKEFHELLKENVPLLFANCTICLDKIENNNEHKFDEYYYQLAESFKRTNSLKEFDERTGKGIAILWDKINNEDNWLKSILSNLSSEEFKNEDKDTIENWFSILKPILLKLHELDKLNLLKDNLSVPGNADNYLKLLSLVNEIEFDAKKEIAKYLQPNTGSAEIIKSISSFIGKDNAPEDLGGAVQLMVLSKGIVKMDEWNWSSIISQASSVITVGSKSETKDVVTCLKIMLVLKENLEVESAINTTQSQNFRDGLFYFINKYDENPLLGLLVTCSILFNPESSKKQNNNEVNQGSNKLNQIISDPDGNELTVEFIQNCLSDFDLMEKFFDTAHSKSSLKSLAQNIINKTFELETDHVTFNANLTIRYYNLFKDALGEEKFIAHLERLFKTETGLVDKILEGYTNIPDNYELHFYLANGCSGQVRKKYYEYLASGFQNMKEEEWISHLKGETKLIHLLILISQDISELNLSIPLKNGLFDHFKKVYKGEVEVNNEWIKSNWSILLDCIKNDLKITLLRDIKDYIESDSEGSIIKVDEIYGPLLIENEIYLENPEPLVRKVFSRILAGKNEDELSWLYNLISVEPNIMKKAGEAREYFKEEIRAISEKERSEVIKNIAAELDVKFKKGKSGNKE